ncbi:MAG: hypothetical protein MST00_06740 [Tenericutes bacterium]|nr:hypothetical protein [Mycoplasmatota bacterium]
MIENIEENTYFKNVIKDAVRDLKNNKVTYVFFQEQVDAVKQIINKEVEVSFDGTFYKIALIKEKNNVKSKKL